MAARVRATVPPPASVADEVAGIVHGVREGGDVALSGYEARFGSGTPGLVPPDELAAALEALAARHGLALIVDEVFGDYAHEGLAPDRLPSFV
ncbi:MAG: hypothetical protein ACRDPU_00250, partial [Thermoleophilia bacterium]